MDLHECMHAKGVQTMLHPVNPGAGADPLLELDRELHALVQLVQASRSICETAHVQHQDLW